MKEQIISEEVMNKWETQNNNKYSYSSGNEPINVNKFAQLIIETFHVIQNFKRLLLGENMYGKQNNLEIATKNDVKSVDIIDYANLMVEIGKYSVDLCTDESEDYIFTASQVLARMLLNYAYFHCRVAPTDDDGVLIGYCEDCELYKKQRHMFPILRKPSYSRS